jgi:prepilin-type N-terminal cleavage/methylation domain-containing protein
MQWAKKHQGFTIVELLIVVVVIAILAAITIVSYNGIINRANASTVQSATQEAAKKINLYAIDNNETYPADSAVLSTIGVINSGDMTYQYTANNTTIPAGYCVTATKNNTSYYIASSYTYLDGSPITINKLNPTEGVCPSHSQQGAPLTNFATNPSVETNASGFLNPNGSTVARDTVRANHGAASLLVTMPVSEPSLVGARIYTTPAVGSAGGLKVSTKYTVSAYVYVPTGTVDVYMSIQGAGATNPGMVSERIASAKNQWIRVYDTFDTTASGQVSLFILNNASTAVNGTQFWIDSIMVTEGATPRLYADGGSAGWTWSGTQHLSTSSGPAL